MEIVKTKKTIYKIKTVATTPLIYSKNFEEIRKGFKNKFKTCFKCNKRFKYDDEMYILFMFNNGNKVVCKNCKHEIEQQLAEEL